MIKSKPALHIRKNDVIISRSLDGVREFEDIVIKAEEYDMDNRQMKIVYAPTYSKLASGARFEVAPSAYVLYWKNDQVLYKER